MVIGTNYTFTMRGSCFSNKNFNLNKKQKNKFMMLIKKILYIQMLIKNCYGNFYIIKIIKILWLENFQF